MSLSTNLDKVIFTLENFPRIILLLPMVFIMVSLAQITEKYFGDEESNNSNDHFNDIYLLILMQCLVEGIIVVFWLVTQNFHISVISPTFIVGFIVLIIISYAFVLSVHKLSP